MGGILGPDVGRIGAGSGPLRWTGGSAALTQLCVGGKCRWRRLPLSTSEPPGYDARAGLGPVTGTGGKMTCVTRPGPLGETGCVA